LLVGADVVPWRPYPFPSEDGGAPGVRLDADHLLRGHAGAPEGRKPAFASHAESHEDADVTSEWVLEDDHERRPRLASEIHRFIHRKIHRFGTLRV
jgi:hypothetical protein